MAFLANTLLEAALWQYKAAGQPEVYINMNLVATMDIDRSKNVVYLSFGELKQGENPSKVVSRVLEFDAAKAFIADLDTLFSQNP